MFDLLWCSGVLCQQRRGSETACELRGISQHCWWVSSVTLTCNCNQYHGQMIVKLGVFQGWAGMTFGSSGTGTGMDNSIPEVREREGNWKNPFPQFGNGKGMKKKHSQNLGMGREWKNLFPKLGKGYEKNQSPQFGNGDQRLSYPKVPGNGNEKKT